MQCVLKLHEHREFLNSAASEVVSLFFLSCVFWFRVSEFTSFVIVLLVQQVLADRFAFYVLLTESFLSTPIPCSRLTVVRQRLRIFVAGSQWFVSVFASS
jgi:hypothetical protein